MRWIARLPVLLAALAVLTVCGQARAEPRLTWRVENPFRFFNDPADTEVHRATWLALSTEDRRTPVLAAERALSARHEDGWAATMYRKTCWNSARNRHLCPEGRGYVNPAHHQVVVELQGVEDATAVTCTWLTAPKGGRETRGQSLVQPCHQPVRLAVPYPDGLAVTVEIGGLPIVERTLKVTDLLIVGMGDSFASGEGNPDVPVRFSRERAADYGPGELSGYPARIGSWQTIGDKEFIGENARWLDQACHRSLYSHQLRAALQLSLEDPHRAVTYVGLACSGAEVTSGLFLRYKGNEWVPNPPELSQISSAAQAQCGDADARAHDLPEAYHMNGQIPELKGGLELRKCEIDEARKIDLILVSIGGNDIGFSRLLANAVLADQSLLKKLGGWLGEVYGQAEANAQLGRLGDRLKSLNRALHNVLHVPWNESDRIVVTAYPGMALLGDGSAVCPDGHPGMEVVADFRLSGAKAREGTWIADKLHRGMLKSAAAHSWTFVEAHRRGFIGRGICAGFTDNAFSIADDLRLPRRTAQGWHPYNPADYRAYATRQRWFRTPNDAFMTGNFHVSQSLLEKVLKLQTLSWFQLLLASTYSGAFHPTAEGQAAIADAVAEKARGVLDKYARAPRQVVQHQGPPDDQDPTSRED